MGHFAWEGDHIRLLLLPRDSKGLNKDVVRQISASLRKIRCRMSRLCVLIGFHSWQLVMIV